MNPVYINGIGLITRCGDNLEDIWNTLCSDTAVDSEPEAVKYTSVFEKSDLRRITRYAKLAAEVSSRCATDAGITDMKNRNNEKMGILFTTGYGAAESNVKFFNSVAKREPDFCSPLTFSSVVPNYALGNVCILFGIKGYSTAMLGGNPLDLAVPVLLRGKAEDMIIGAQEEYCKEVFEAVNSVRPDKEKNLAECSTALYMSSVPIDSSYASVVATGSCALDNSPFLCCTEYPTESTINDILNEALNDEKPDVIFGIGTQLNIGKSEKETFNRILPNAEYISSVREFFGETLGSSFLLNVAIASMCLKNNKIPFAENREVNSILVTGVDVQGNYMYTLLKTV